MLAQNDESLAEFKKDWSDNVEVDISSYFDRVLSAQSQSLLDGVDLDIDLYDLGSLDIGNGAGRDNLGLTHANALIHWMKIHNTSSASGSSLIVDSSQSGGWTSWLPSGTHTLGPGERIFGLWFDGLAVADSTNHILRLTASGDVTFDFEFLSSQ